MKRDPYEVLGVSRAGVRQRDQEGVPQARPRAASGREHRGPAKPRRSSRRRRRRTRSCPTPSGARSTTATATRDSARAASIRRSRASARSPTSSTRSSAAATRSAPGARGQGAVQGGDVAVQAEVSLQDAARGTSVQVEYERVGPCERCKGNGAKPGTPIDTCGRCDGTGELRTVARTAFGQIVRNQVCDVCMGEGKTAREPCEECRGRGRKAVRTQLEVNVPPGIADDQRIRLTGHGHAGERGGPAGRPLRARPRPARRALPARGRRPDHRRRRARAGRGARARRSRCRRSRATRRSRSSRARSPAS